MLRKAARRGKQVRGDPTFLACLSRRVQPSRRGIGLPGGALVPEHDRPELPAAIYASATSCSARIELLSPAGNLGYEDPIPSTPESPDAVRNGILEVVLGLMPSIGLAPWRNTWTTVGRSPQEVEQITGVHTFGTIPGLGL